MSSTKSLRAGIVGFRGYSGAELVRILNSSDMKEKLAVQGAEARTNSPEAFGGFIAKEKERWAKVVKGAGIKIE